MKSTRMWIADSQEAYAKAFMEYVNLKKSHLFQVRMCAGKEQLLKAFAEEEIEILLITAKWYEDCKDLIRRECVILLSEGSLPAKLRIYPAIYKYQSVENMLREVMYYYSEQGNEEAYFTGVPRDNRVIGVYSPIGGIGKTIFALTLGQILAEHENVLYLNMEECSGFMEFIGESQWNLSDLIYFLRQGKTPFLYRLNSMVQKLDRLDYILPCSSYTDFRQITVEEWKKLLHLIRTQSAYDSVILDFGNLMGHETELLAQCDGIYVLVRPDAISQAKIAQWKHFLQTLGSMEIMEKLQTLELPAAEASVEGKEELPALAGQRLGSYIRGLLQE